MYDFHIKLEDFRQNLLKHIEAILSEKARSFEIERPPKLLEAMRYSALNMGKALRAFLVYSATEMLGGPVKHTWNIGSAIELIHCYSLIHDDLPSMDNDSMRRGKPTLHKYYDEATAILTGDALLTLAFEVLSRDDFEVTPTVKLALINQLGQACGVGGMVGGQIYDLAYEKQQASEEQILRTHSMKTGALWLFCLRSAALICGADQATSERLEAFGAALGLAFQLSDDIIDATSTSEKLGKTAGKDLGSAKATIVTLYGIEEAKKQLKGLINEAKLMLDIFGEKARDLLHLVDFIEKRQF